MAKSRSLATNLARVFDASDSVVYVVQRSKSEQDDLSNATSVIAYANDACLEWIGVDFQTLKTTRLIYSAEPLPDAAENQIRGLAIPFPPTKPTTSEPTRQLDVATTPYAVIFSTAAEARPDPESQSESNGAGAGPAPSNFRLAQLIRLGPSRHKKQDIENWLVLASPKVFNKPPAWPDPAQPLLTNQLHAVLADAATNHALRHSMAALVGKSDVSIAIRASVEIAIRAPRLNVTISGPAGAGKEHLARTIIQRRYGDLSPFDFHFLDCRIADPQSIQSTLQQLNKLTGNEARRRSEDHPAQLPTLTLLEADKLNQACQQELLGFFRLPGFQLNTIATTTDTLRENNSIHPLLRALLSPMQISLPPLRERPDDIPLLAQRMLENCNREFAHASGKQVSRLSNAALSLMMEYDWPNNLDELSTAVQTAFETASGDEIRPEELPEFIKLGIRAKQLEPARETTIELTNYLESIETELVQRAMVRAKGNKTKASNLLGISRPRLLRRLKQLGLHQWLETKEEPVEFIDVENFEEVDDD